MKGQHVITRKALLAMSLVLVLLAVFASCKSLNTSTLDNSEAYDVINDLFGNRQIVLYHKTIEEPKWDQLIHFDTIFSRVGLPTTISDADLKNVVTEGDLKEIRLLIQEPETSIINGDLLDGIELSKRKKVNVFQISTPIVYGDVAILRKISENEVPIYILKKKNGKWDFLYTFYQKLIFY
jgi:hypothetical protein